MLNGDFIRNMDNDRLGRFLFTWGINTMVSFMEQGGCGPMDAKELREWLDADEFICNQTRVGKDFIYDQNFNLKREGD